MTATDAPYRDPRLGIDERIEDLIGRMTPSEKLAQLGGEWISALVSEDRFDVGKARELIGDGIGQITRIGASTGLRPQGAASLYNEVQRFCVEGTRLGVPAILHEESVGGLCARGATVFPQGIGLASTWDPVLVRTVAEAIRDEMLAVGARQTLSPVLDIARDPRWGRVEETYGESPVLAGTMGAAYVRGLQTDDLRGGVICTGKHFLGYGLPEGGMNHAPVHLGPRELREVYAEPFAAAIRDAGLASIMNSYSSVDGLPCAGSGEILTELLRGELGFEGFVVADYFAVSLLLVHHHTAGDAGEAAVQALEAGLDVELPARDCFGEPLEGKLRAGEVDEAVVEGAVRRVLTAKIRLGLLEDPFVDAGAAPAVFDTPAHRELARRAAASSAILLRNDGALPLDPDTSTIAVVGPAADDRRLLQGDYHYPAHVEIVYEGGPLPGAGDGGPGSGDEVAFLPEGGGVFAPGPHYTPHVTPLDGIREAASGEVLHARGCAVDGEPEGIVEAVEAARGAEAAVVCVGGRSGLRPHSTVGEARDAVDLGLTGPQEELVRAVAATGTPTVVVVLSGRVHALPWLEDVGSAALQLWPPGEEGGHALADVLFGRVNPAGRLPVTVPRSVGQVPVHHDHRTGGGRSQFYGDYTDSPAAPLYPFGHGLSYTSFDYGPLRAEGGTTADPIRLDVEVTNTGDRPGDEVVQLYVRDDVAAVARPYRQLVGFVRVSFEPAETRRVRFTVHPSRLAFYDARMRFVTEPGGFTFWVGASAVDLRSQAAVELGGEGTEYRQRETVATAVEVG